MTTNVGNVLKAAISLPRPSALTDTELALVSGLDDFESISRSALEVSREDANGHTTKSRAAKSSNSSSSGKSLLLSFATIKHATPQSLSHFS